MEFTHIQIKLYLINIFINGIASNDATYYNIVKQLANEAKVYGMKVIKDSLGSYDAITSVCYRDVLHTMYPKQTKSNIQEKLLLLL